MAELFQQTKPFVSSWSSTPVPALSLSAAGLLALADLSTVAHRTIITGGSSWLDAFVLAPGLHYQQAAGALLGQDPLSEPDGVKKAAMEQYTPRLRLRAEPAPGMEMDMEMDWLSHVLYLASPGLTLIAGTLMVLLRDWWGTAFMAALVASRVLNIWSIKQRTRRPPRCCRKRTPVPSTSPPPSSSVPEKQGECAADMGDGSRVRAATTTQTWLRQQTAAESHLEAAAKLIVYLVAAFSGNQTQAGAMVLMALLLASAGLLGLSNAHSRGLRMNGPIARADADVVGDRENGRVGGKLFEDLELN
ncbi:Eukaryotic peptide chain release factor subunit 1 [Epichloe bromicola]|uniref:Eukaryotic peptide chain release factor subunit 1 n=1 Tax=Epichloe bromicola TaxID=79588 RepID=A0ABQ0CI81_9HYPO